jgi:hypothetical protein
MFRRRALACSFCGASADQVSQLIAGPAVHICGRCLALCNQVMEEATASPSGGAETDEGLLVSVRATSATVDSLSDLLHERVAELRRRGVSWQKIADALGTSRQSAWERFRSAVSEPGPDVPGPGR